MKRERQRREIVSMRREREREGEGEGRTDQSHEFVEPNAKRSSENLSIEVNRVVRKREERNTREWRISRTSFSSLSLVSVVGERVNHVFFARRPHVQLLPDRRWSVPSFLLNDMNLISPERFSGDPYRAGRFS